MSRRCCDKAPACWTALVCRPTHQRGASAVLCLNKSVDERQTAFGRQGFHQFGPLFFQDFIGKPRCETGSRSAPSGRSVAETFGKQLRRVGFVGTDKAAESRQAEVFG